MPFAVEHDSARRIVHIRYTEPLTSTDLQQGTTAAGNVQKETGATRFLVEEIECEVELPLVDVYNLPEKQYVMEDIDRRSRVAVVVPATESGRQAARFYETVCRNRGWNVRLCPDRRAALDWLLSAGVADESDSAIKTLL